MKHSKYVAIEQSLREKLKEIGDPKEGDVLAIQLTKEEAELYDVNVNDVMEEDELIIESEGNDE